MARKEENMQKIKLLTGIIAFSFIGLFLTRPVSAATIVQIQTLPGYINYTDFKLTCTTNGSSAQFYSMKDGGSYTAFGPTIDLTVNPCSVQVNGTQFGSEGKFWFEVIVDGVSSQTSVTLDTTAPSAVSDFGKDRVNAGTTYRIHWKNPTDTDYAKVIIYRGTEAGFTADDTHKIADGGGNPGDTMSWDDNGLDPNKEYYYNIRALDKAGNSSSLVGDSGTTTTVLGASTTPISGGVVTVLPKEKASGSVLGTQASPSTSPETTNTSVNTNPGLGKWILTHKKISGGIAMVLLAIAYGFYYFSKKNK